MTGKRDHGGGLDAAVAAFGGLRGDWLDLSTGINPVPYPVGQVSTDAWTALPDEGAMDRLLATARTFWRVPDGAQIVAANGASALIARLPHLTNLIGGAYIPGPTYNEHAAAIRATDSMWLSDDPEDAVLHTYVHPNNPDGKLWGAAHMGGRPLTVIDESFCDVTPAESHIDLTEDTGVIVLKSFGKFWGLAGLRLGFAIASPGTFAPVDEVRLPLRKPDHIPLATLKDHLGPWAVSGPALEIGARALADRPWAEATRARLKQDATRLDALMTAKDADVVGGTTLFRLYDVEDASAWQSRLTRGHVWSRVFPYNPRWLRLGLPSPDRWGQLETALS